MKIVSRKELMAMPVGTLYHQWTPCYFHDLAIKGETCGTDWYEVNVPSLHGESGTQVSDGLDRLDEGASVPVDMHLEGREALFDDTLRYAVWEREDVVALYERLAVILGSA